jgi:CheY-like chemotaxis protein
MNILILIAAIWTGFFGLAIALAGASNRSRRLAADTGTTDFGINPLLVPRAVDQLKPLREAVAAKLNSPTERRAKRVSSGEKEMIFVVDDDPDIVSLIKHVLDLEGFEVRSFTDPEEALEEFKISSRRPEMVVTDYAMQPMNGLDLISRCRESKPDLKTIVISGMVHESDFRKLPTHTDRFLEKPFKVSNLIQTLNDTLAEEALN